MMLVLPVMTFAISPALNRAEPGTAWLVNSPALIAQAREHHVHTCTMSVAFVALLSGRTNIRSQSIRVGRWQFCTGRADPSAYEPRAS